MNLERVLADGDRLALAGGTALLAAIASWYGLGALACRAAHAWPHLRSVRRVAAYAPGRVRRTLGVACGASIAIAPAAYAADEPVVRVPTATAAVEISTSVTPRPIASGGTYAVMPGDNLWSIARAEIARSTGTADPADHVVAPYWQRLIDRNRASLRSGDPSLIFPGELVELPEAG